MPISAALKLINLLLALTAFLIVGATSVSSGEDLLWSVVRAIGAFVICWIALSFLSNLLLSVMDMAHKDEEPDSNSREIPSGS